MARDKSWVLLDDHKLEQYRLGCVEFLDFAFKEASIDGHIKCPCKDCRNKKFGDRDSVHRHLLWRGMCKVYGQGLWMLHNERATHHRHEAEFSNMNQTENGDVDIGDNMDDLLRACCYPTQEDPSGAPIPESDDFRKLIEEANTPLYPGCKDYSKLSFVIELYQIKSRGKMSDKTFSETLKLIKKALPHINVPESFYETKKLIGKLGCSYNKIDACENDCMLFWKEDKDLDVCKVCNASRWKISNGNQQQSSLTSQCSKKVPKKVPKKVLRHFPLIPRLQRLYMSKKTATDMRWHAELRCDDGILRHPADSDAWKEFDKKHESFSLESRNVRLGLASDGFNPFGSMSSKYSTWPVILMAYNLPPGMCMQRSYMMMSLLISGSKGPKNNIDVYLQPLIEELKVLWGPGVTTFDASVKQYFNMRAALMWTINDFPAYGNLSGWSTSGYLACPSCGENTVSERLYKSNKQCYMGHSRYSKEGAPPPPSGEDVLSRTEGINITFGVGQRVPMDSQWRKRSIFFNLPYWKDNLIRHNLDVMHVEKNVGELLMKWLLNILNKCDGFNNAKEDIAKIRKPPKGKTGPRFPLLVPKLRKYHKLSSQEKKAVCDVISAIKVPNGYASNIARCVHEDKIGGLKSHDYHVLMQQLLPLAVRNAGLPKNMAGAIIDMCSFFRGLCSKTNTAEDFKKLHSEIVKTLCMLENLFPPAFFVVMVHLTVHLADEARVAGPVHYRWMYPIERYLGHLKSFVRNKNCPEGSIAECYITEECLNFCSQYMESEESVQNCPSQNCDGSNNRSGLSIFCDIETSHDCVDGGVRPKFRTLNYDEMEKAHNYCLFNCNEVIPYIEEHFEVIKNRIPRSDDKYKWRIQGLHDKEFRFWFRSRVQGAVGVDADLLDLAQSPAMKVQTYKNFNVQGFRFRTNSSEESNNTQNSGVVVKAKTTSFASTKDNSPREGDVIYYGVIKDIIKVSFVGGRDVVLFECDWVDINKNKTDSYGFTLVDFTRPALNVNPFVLPSQVLQAFYVRDPRDSPWMVPIVTKPRDNFALDSEEPMNDVEEGCLEIFPIQTTNLPSTSDAFNFMEE